MNDTIYIKRSNAVKALRDYADRKLANGDPIEYINGIVKAASFLTDHVESEDVRPNTHGKNIGKDYADCDQFVCSECGIELQDWVRVERDEDDGDVTYHEHVFNFCPNCGADLGEKSE